MKFSLRTPCKDCPFLKGRSYLTPERAEEIATVTLKGNKTFTCHKHLHGDRNGEDLEYSPAMNDQHCAGALIMSELNGRPNAMHQVAARLGIYDPSRLDMSAEVYTSIEEMREGHE